MTWMLIVVVLTGEFSVHEYRSDWGRYEDCIAKMEQVLASTKTKDRVTAVCVPK